MRRSPLPASQTQFRRRNGDVTSTTGTTRDEFGRLGMAPRVHGPLRRRPPQESPWTRQRLLDRNHDPASRFWCVWGGGCLRPAGHWCPRSPTTISSGAWPGSRRSVIFGETAAAIAPPVEAGQLRMAPLLRRVGGRAQRVEVHTEPKKYDSPKGDASRGPTDPPCHPHRRSRRDHHAVEIQIRGPHRHPRNYAQRGRPPYQRCSPNHREFFTALDPFIHEPPAETPPSGLLQDIAVKKGSIAPRVGRGVCPPCPVQ